MRSVWSNTQGNAVVLYAVKGGGHVVHQPYARQPRWLGAMNPGFDVAAQACAFWQL
jgi:poly(3-hydroxybutyrate) depolymerase